MSVEWKRPVKRGNERRGLRDHRTLKKKEKESVSTTKSSKGAGGSARRVALNNPWSRYRLGLTFSS